jgi:hypothetical protein
MAERPIIGLPSHGYLDAVRLRPNCYQGEKCLCSTPNIGRLADNLRGQTLLTHFWGGAKIAY